MSRQISSSQIDDDPNFVLPISSGGTTAITAKNASKKLDYVTKDEIGMPEGLVPLDANGLLPINFIPNIIIDKTEVKISGPLTLGIGLSSEYTIDNYNPVLLYQVSASSGSVAIAGKKITFTAPMVKGSASFTVNGSSIYITVIDEGDNPVVVGPLTVVSGSTNTYTITNYNRFSTYQVYSDTAQVSIAGNTITLVAPAIYTGSMGAFFYVNSTKIQLTVNAPPGPIIEGPTSMVIGTTKYFSITNFESYYPYKISCTGGTFVHNAGDSLIAYTSPKTPGTYTLTVNSTSVSINVTYPAIDQPKFITPVNGAANMDKVLTLYTSTFTAQDGLDTQYGSSWEVATDLGFTKMAFSSYNDTVNLTSWKLSNLAQNTTYYARVRYQGKTGSVSPYSPVISFSTKPIFCPTVISAIISGPAVQSGVVQGFANGMATNGTVIAAIYFACTASYTTLLAYEIWLYRNVNGTWTKVGSYDIKRNYPTTIPTKGPMSLMNLAVLDFQGNILTFKTQSGAEFIMNYNSANDTLSVITGKTDLNPTGFSYPPALSINRLTRISPNQKVIAMGSPLQFLGFSQDAVLPYGLSAGMVYVATRQDSSLRYEGTAVLAATNLPAGSDGSYAYFGNELLLTDTELFVASVGLRRVYVYNYTTGNFVLSQILTPTPPANVSNAYFGGSMAYDRLSNTLMISDPNASVDGAANMGVVYLFNKGSTWTQSSVIKPTGAGSNTFFGSVLSAGPNYFATRRTEGGPIYVYYNAGGAWELSSTISTVVKPDPGFGYSIVANNGLCIANNTTVASLTASPPPTNQSIYVLA